MKQILQFYFRVMGNLFLDLRSLSDSVIEASEDSKEEIFSASKALPAAMAYFNLERFVCSCC